MNDQIVTVNVHHPRARYVERLSVGHDDMLHINLGQRYAGSVALLLTGAEWDALVADVALMRAKLTPVAAVKNEDPRYISGASSVDDDMTDAEWDESMGRR